MVLEYLGIRRDYDWLSKVLETTDVGTPFLNVERLRRVLGVSIELHDNGSLAIFAPCIEMGLPLIVAVDADNLSLWPHYHNHAVVVVGFNTDHVYINNPAAEDAPQEVNIDTFLWAWSRRDYEYAVIRLVDEP
jgi:ABC-type bacteriocin/lantibiotic exporter with double-glycine peptidase domain